MNHVMFPGDTMTLQTPINFKEDSYFAVEPRESNLKWPEPCVVENEKGYISMTNNLEYP